MVDRKKNFYKTVVDAINDMLEHGFDSMDRVDKWQDALRHAAEASLLPEDKMVAMLRDGLTDIYERLVNKGKIIERHPGLSLFTVNDLKPELRKLLDSRIMASANLIKLNKKQSVEKTLQRFAGWATSIPAGGTDQQKRAKVKGTMGAALKSLPFEERRVLVDQGHKLTASINEVVAIGGQAIAARWRSHWRQSGYDYRVDHKERDQEVYLLEDTWATRAGLVKPGNKGYYGQKSTKAGEEVFCRCFIVWIYALRDLPPDMLTVKGKNELDRVRAELST